MNKKTQKPSGGKPEQKPIRPPKKGERQLRVDFTEKELLNIAKQLAEANSDLQRAEDDKKAVTSQLKAKCDSIGARVGELSGKINSGFEYRNVQIETRYDDPKPGMKTTVRLDNNEVIECETMTLAELQTDLPLGENVVPMTSKPGERPPLRTVTGSGVVATDEDGEGEALQDDDDNKI